MIDTHCHLNDEKLLPIADRIVGDFAHDKIASAICVGYDMPSSRLAVELADKYEPIYCAVGIHPHDADTANAVAYDELKALANNVKCVAIGEIGLDYYYDLSEREVQRKAFREQIELADALKLPVVLHVRDAYEDARQILFDMKKYLNSGVLLHCYSGSSEYVKVFDKLGAYYSFGGAITFKNARHNIEALATVPLDRLVLETDCPYMTPVPFRGQVNEPKYVALVLEKAAQVLDIGKDELEKITTENAKRLFYRMK